jgi:membrane fusion protein (multidrug efflux system)
VLFTLDERPFRIAVAEAQAQLAGARLRIEAMKATYQQRLADRQAAQDLLAYRQTELQRQQRLAAAGISSRAQLDQALHEADAARQQLAASRESIANIMADLGGTADVPIEQHPSLRQAQAQLDRALLNLSYTTIKAPTDGIATKVEQIQAGDYITASTPVFALMSNSDIWVEANFKETDLTHMRIGQRAEITIDSYPDRVFDGQLISLSPGTGSSFSLLPPENATGNWVKVVQRLAVRIAFDPLPADVPLRAGLSVTVHVDTQHHRTLFGGKAPSP